MMRFPRQHIYDDYYDDDGSPITTDTDSGYDSDDSYPDPPRTHWRRRVPLIRHAPSTRTEPSRFAKFRAATRERLQGWMEYVKDFCTLGFLSCVCLIIVPGIVVIALHYGGVFPQGKSKNTKNLRLAGPYAITVGNIEVTPFDSNDLQSFWSTEVQYFYVFSFLEVSVKVQFQTERLCNVFLEDFQVDLLEPSMQAPKSGVFHNAEAAFEASQWWSDAKVFSEFQAAKTHEEVMNITVNTPSTWQHWDRDKDGIMKAILRRKFASGIHGDLQKFLCATGGALLLNHAPDKESSDTFWSDGHDGSGENNLGWILMQLRQELCPGVKSSYGEMIDHNHVEKASAALNKMPLKSVHKLAHPCTPS